MAIYVVNQKTGLKYVFTGVSNWRDEKSKDVVQITLPEQDSTQAQVLSFSGIEQDISFSFKLIPRDDDASGGTNTTPVKTVEEQYQYLMEDLYTASADTKYTLYHDALYPSGIEGLITRINITLDGEEPNMGEGMIEFKVGQNPI